MCQGLEVHWIIHVGENSEDLWPNICLMQGQLGHLMALSSWVLKTSVRGDVQPLGNLLQCLMGKHFSLHPV